MIKFFGAAVAAAALANSAMATVTVSSVNGPDTGVPAGMTLIYDFDTITPTDGTDITGDYGIVSASIPDITAAPLGTPVGTNYLTVPLASIPGTATLKLNGAYKTLSFYWGSIDTYNTVEFFDASDVSLGFVTGGSVPPAPADGSQGSALNNRRVTFSFGGAAATSIKLSSDKYAFELDTIAGAVPEPATWAMLVVGMGLVGGSMRRRRSVATVAA